MDVRYKVVGKHRKELALHIARITEEEVKYLGVPSCAYQIGPSFTIDKAGTLIIDDYTQSDVVEDLLEELAKLGYQFEAPKPATDEQGVDTLEITVNVEDFSEIQETNLYNLIRSKETLLKKALGTNSLDFKREGDKLTFPWFTLTGEQDEAQAYQQLVVALIDKAKKAKRIRPLENDTDNEKFTFRVFMIGLGMVGEQFKTARKILMKNLSGNSAFRNRGKDHVSN